MKQNIENAIEWLKNIHTPEYNVRGCITGSCWLGYFEGQDIDLFVYDEASLRNVLYAMYFNDMFQILDKKEKWKFEQHINSPYDKKPPILTIKFTYNTCVDVNIILKKNCSSIHQVLSSFDLDIVSAGYDLETKQFLDLREGSNLTKIGSWNKWNTNYYDPTLWQSNRILRQFGRLIKYYKRGYNTDTLAEKYIEIINDIQKYQDIWSTEKSTEKIKIIKNNTKIMKQIIEVWLETHEITDEQMELVETKLREI